MGGQGPSQTQGCTDSPLVLLLWVLKALPTAWNQCPFSTSQEPRAWYSKMHHPVVVAERVDEVSVPAWEPASRRPGPEVTVVWARILICSRSAFGKSKTEHNHSPHASEHRAGKCAAYNRSGFLQQVAPEGAAHSHQWYRKREIVSCIGRAHVDRIAHRDFMQPQRRKRTPPGSRPPSPWAHWLLPASIS